MKRSSKRTTSPKLTAVDCVTALRDKYPEGPYAFLEQVANGTGWKANRWADAIAFSLWPSRGLTLHGFEIKVSRSDWVRELKDPAKSADIQGYCDHWSIVAPDGLIPVHELPPTWGLLEVTDKRKIVVTHPATSLQANPLDRSIVAALLRRSSEAITAMQKRERAAGRKEGAANGAGELSSRLAIAEKRVQEAWDTIDAFEAASGLNLRHAFSGPKNLGEVVKVVLNGEYRIKASQVIGQEIQAHRAAADALEKQILELEKVEATR